MPKVTEPIRAQLSLKHSESNSPDQVFPALTREHGHPSFSRARCPSPGLAVLGAEGFLKEWGTVEFGGQTGRTQHAELHQFLVLAGSTEGLACVGPRV